MIATPSLACSFEPNGAWFVFDEQTGRTVKRGFASRRQADGWIVRRAQARGGQGGKARA